MPLFFLSLLFALQCPLGPLTRSHFIRCSLSAYSIRAWRALEENLSSTKGIREGEYQKETEENNFSAGVDNKLNPQ